ncbi:MAG: SRPBCC family protein [Candidatus Thorarchaeota archaeon]
MKFFEEMIIEDSIEIRTSIDQLWDFFENLEDNYISWHPQDHVVCRWIKGRPHEVDSVAYFEEILDGKLFKIKVKTTKVEKFKYSESKPFFPLSIFHPKGAYSFESSGNKCIFTAINYFRIPKLFTESFFAYAKIEALKRHIKEEGASLKNLLENPS